MIRIGSALTFLAIALGSAVTGMYAEPDQGLNQILYWFAIVCLGVTAGFTLAYLASRRSRF
jgi:hypothetical protein